MKIFQCLLTAGSPKLDQFHPNILLLLKSLHENIFISLKIFQPFLFRQP